MTLPSSDNLIGKQLSDSYGRYFGTIVGINTDESGSICSIGVDAGCHGFQTIGVNQITFMDDNPVLVSNWKFKAESLIKTSGAAQKRIQALEDLHREGEISQAIYEQLVSRNKAQFDLCLKNCDDAVASLNEKTAVIQNEKSIIAAFFGVLKLQHRMQEIDDSTYQSTSEHLETILQRNDKEANDISSILNSLTLQEPEPVQETVSVEVPTTNAQMDTPILEQITETDTQVPCEQISEALAPEIVVSASEDVAPTTVEQITETDTQVPCEQISEALAPEIVVSASEDVAPTTVEETVSIDADAKSSEIVDNISVDDNNTPLGSEIPVEMPSLNEVPENSTEQTLEVPAEPASVETTDVSDHMPLDDSVQADNESETSQTASSDIADSVSFENEDAETVDTPVSTKKANRNHRNSYQSRGSDAVYTTQ